MGTSWYDRKGGEALSKLASAKLTGNLRRDPDKKASRHGREEPQAEQGQPK